MKFINKYLRNFEPYRLASHKIWMVNPQQRKDILKLDWNESAIPPSPLVGERIRRLAEQGDFFHYYPSTYNAQLMELLSQYTQLPCENIQYFASSDSLHEYIAKLYITVGDPVLILGPSYDNFRLTAQVCGAELYYYYVDDNFQFDSDKFCEVIEDKDPSLVYICNPNNPTGNQLQAAYLEYLLKRYPAVLFLADEAYCEFSGCTAKNLVTKYENILISRTMSKAFGMANFRFGYLIASQNNIEYISSIRNPKNITTFAQEAAIGALSDIDYMKNYVKEVRLAKKYFQDELSSYGEFLTFPKGEGNFQLIRCKSGRMKKEIIEYLMKNNIFVRDVSQTALLREYCIRITIGTREQMARVLECLNAYFKQSRFL